MKNIVLEMLILWAQGKSIRQIASKVGKSESTVYHHLARELGVSPLTEKPIKSHQPKRGRKWRKV